MSSLRTVPYGSTTRLASGTIRNSLFGATDEAGLPDSVAAELADIFSTDIDFHRELRKGDTFSVVYESLTADDQPVPWNEGAGRVLAAEFVNGGRAHHAVWFAPTNGRGGYFGVMCHERRQFRPIDFGPWHQVTLEVVSVHFHQTGQQVVPFQVDGICCLRATRLNFGNVAVLCQKAAVQHLIGKHQARVGKPG